MASRFGVAVASPPDMTATDIVLSGEQRERLRDALVAAFPDADDLTEFVSFRMEEARDALSDEKLSRRAFRLVEWARAHGRLRELVDKAHAANPGCPRLKDFVASLKPQPSPIDVADLQSLEAFAVATLNAHPVFSGLLVSQVGCTADVLPRKLLHELPARDLVRHFLAVDRMLGSAKLDERTACHAMLFRVLPAAADWQTLRELVRVSPNTKPKPVALPYRSATVAEIVLAGAHDRACKFRFERGRLPFGVGLVRAPAASDAAVFTDGPRLVEAVVQQIAARIGFEVEFSRIKVDKEAAALRTGMVQTALRLDRAGITPGRLQYYFLFQDEEHPSDVLANQFWTLTRDALSAELDELQVVRMGRNPARDELEITIMIHELLRMENP